MSTLQGLLVGCAESPDDSTPHLILADWLEDHGQAARAELVRIQCRLADWVPNLDERQRLTERQDTLIADHRADWLGPLAGAIGKVDFVRGLARVTMRSGTFSRRRFREQFQQQSGAALIEQVRFTHCTSLYRLLRYPSLDLVPAISLEKLNLDDPALTTLTAEPLPSNLIALDLSNNPLGTLDHTALTQFGWQANLVRLDLRNTVFSTKAVDRLLGLTGRDGQPLRLDLAGLPLTPEQIEQVRPRLPGQRQINSLGMEFQAIPAGEYLRGSPNSDPVARDNEQPQHRVTLTQPFWMGRFAVTQGQYLAVLGENPTQFPGDMRRAMDSVSWTQAMLFCESLSKRPAEKAAGRSYRLPTEAEWEHACRAGTETAFNLGPPPSADLVNYDGRYRYGGAPSGPYLRRTSEVGAYPPNTFGLFEMHGNVWEWCSDWYAEGAYTADPVTDPQGPPTGSGRVRRGGCWDAIGSYCRSAHRNGQDPMFANHFTGFRVVMVPAGPG